MIYSLCKLSKTIYPNSQFQPHIFTLLMTFNKKTLHSIFAVSALAVSLTLGSVSAFAVAPEAALPDSTLTVTKCNYKFNFATYYDGVTNLLNTNPYDKYDPAGGTKFCEVKDGFKCDQGAVVAGGPLLGMYANTVNGVSYPAQGDITVGTGTNYCLNASIPEIFKAIAPSNNVNLIPSIYNVTNKTGAAGESYYVPGFFDNGLCQRNADGSVVMKPEYESQYNNANDAIKNAFRSAIGTRNCNVTQINPDNTSQVNREIYQFSYVIEYPSNQVCNDFYTKLKPKVIQYYEADANGANIRQLYKLVTGKGDSDFTPADLTGFYNYFKAYTGTATSATFGTGTGQIDCPTYYKSAFGSKFGMTSNKGIIATETYHSILNEGSTAKVEWRKVETGRRLSETDPLKKAWDGYAAFNLN
jgi:hypothetical protein